MILELAVENNIDLYQTYDSKDLKNLKNLIMRDLENLLEETVEFSSIINLFSQENINSNEMIVTIDYSETVKQFLIDGSKERKFEVIVV